MTKKDYPLITVQKLHDKWAVLMKRDFLEEEEYDIIATGKSKEEAMLSALHSFYNAQIKCSDALEHIVKSISWRGESAGLREDLDIPRVELEFPKKMSDEIYNGWCKEQKEQCGYPKSSSTAWYDGKEFFQVLR